MKRRNQLKLRPFLHVAVEVRNQKITVGHSTEVAFLDNANRKTLKLAVYQFLELNSPP